jgi:hypothetical protein
MVKETPMPLQLDLVDNIGDVKSLIEEETAWWWNQEIQGYNKTIWMQLLDRKDRKMLQDSVLLEDMQVKQIAEDDTDTVQLYCNIEVHLSLQNKEDGVGVRTLVIMLNDVNMSINIEFEENRTVKDLKNVVLPLVEHRYLAFWFYQKGGSIINGDVGQQFVFKRDSIEGLNVTAGVILCSIIVCG